MNGKLLIFFEGDVIPCEEFNGCCKRLYGERSLSNVFNYEDWKKGVLRVTNYIGFGVICGKTIVVLPKIFKGNINVEEDGYFLDFLALLDIYLGLKLEEQDYSLLRESGRDPNIVFHQIMIHLFSVELERQLTYGLDREYTKYVLESPSMKGRLLLTKQLRKPSYKQHILSLRKHVRTEDTVLNRIFKKTVKEALRNAEWKASIKRISFLQGYFNNVSNIEHGRIRGLINKVSLNRLNERFSTAFTLAKIILLGFYEKPSPETNIGFFIKSEDLFEKIVYTVLKHEFKGEYNVHYQKGSYRFADIISATEDKVGSIKTVPDFILKKKGNIRLVLDAKYKQLRPQYMDNTDREYDEANVVYKVDNRDLYQVYVYTEIHDADGGLVYPLYNEYNKEAMEEWEDRVIRFKTNNNSERKLRLYFIDLSKLKEKKSPFIPEIKKDL